MKKYLKFVCCLLSLLLVLNVQCVYASDSALKINQTKNGLQLHLYKIANRNENGDYTYTSAFSDAKSTSIDLNALKTSSDLDEAAETLKGFAVSQSGIDLTADGDSISYSSLTHGLYLILIDSYKTNDTTYNYLPLLIQFPETSEINLTKYSTTVLHKYSIVKYWKGGSNYPESIKIDLYNGETLEKKLTLTKENSYTYSWETTEDKNYSIREHTVSGYSSSVNVSENQGTQTFVLTNTKNPETTNSNTTVVPGEQANNQTSSSKSNASQTSQTKTTPTANVSKTSGQEATPSYASKRVKTGDETKVNASIILLVIAGLVLIVIGKYLKN